MRKGEKVKSAGGPGGMRCRCCGGGNGRSVANTRIRRGLAKKIRRLAKRIALAD